MDVWGEIIKNIGIAMVLAVAMLSVSALAGCDSEAVLASGIFETEESSIKFPAGQDTNIDSLQVGNDKAFAYGSIFTKTPKATATNNLEIKKNQDSGACAPCEILDETGEVIETIGCTDTCIKVNVDQINVGNREAMAFGFASATNNVKIVANQQ